MSVVGSVVAVLLAVLAVLLCCANAGALVVSTRNARRGVPRHVSMIYVIPQLLVLFAFLLSRLAPDPWLPAALLLGIALADASLWCLFLLPIFLLRRRR